jgi:hypothetical protein
MKERPILFSAPMVRALLNGSKSQTRRVVKPAPSKGWEFENPPVFGRITSPHPKRDRFGAFIRRGIGTDFPEVDLIPCPYGQPGDRLWVREAWSTHSFMDGDKPSELKTRSFHYWADGEITTGKRRPSIHMPRAASRITLEIVSVRVERLQDISGDDCFAEGSPGGHGSIPGYPYAATAQEHYEWLWESINGDASWDKNPWVWAVEFRRIEP